MKKYLTGGVLVAAMTLSGMTATPALADNDDRNRILLGLAALAVIGVAVSRHNEREAERDAREAAARRVLPRYCLQPFDTRQGQVAIFEEHCLNADYAHVARLPAECAVTIRSRGYYIDGFDPRCLHDAGYTVSDR